MKAMTNKSGDNCMYIEFMGLPGSGKSTIRLEVLKYLKNLDEDRYMSTEEAFNKASKVKIDRIYRYLLCILPYRLSIKLSESLMNRNLMQHEAQGIFTAKNGKAINTLLGSDIFDNMSIHDRAIVINSFLETGSLWECINNQVNENQAVLFEEGFIQKSLMFVATSGEQLAKQDQVSRYLNNIPLPDLVVYVKVDIDSSYERMMGRPDGLTQRLSKLSRGDVFSFLQQTERHLELVAEWMNTNHHNKMIIIDSRVQIDVNVKQIANEIIR